MDFEFNDEQRLLDETARRFVANECDAVKRAARLTERDGLSRTMWRRLDAFAAESLPEV